MKELVLLLTLFLVTTFIGCLGQESYDPTIDHHKSVCAAQGVQLLNYSNVYENISVASGKLKVEHAGKDLLCQQGKVETYELSCVIGLKDSNKCLEIMINENKCYIQESKECP